ncbi:MAG: hypothetical protein P4L57_03130 [Rhizomicrobium sp.]|nr:hypothetical protein [Rhizomicrobium sp.]
MNDTDDAAFASKFLKALPTQAVPAALEARILADFDRLALGRGKGWMARFASGWSELLWPGAPLWQPASLLALSLVVGLTAGAFVPSSTAASTDQTYAVADTSSVMDLYKDL